MNYSRLTSWYHLLEWVAFGRYLQRARTAQLESLKGTRTLQRALLIGEGNGSFLLAFRQQFPETQIVVVDQSLSMLVKARARYVKAGFDLDRIEFIEANVFDLTLQPQEYDLITTLFFFDNFDDAQVRIGVRTLLPSLASNGSWLLSDFCIPEKGLLNLRARLWLKMLYLFFRVVAGIPCNRLPRTESILSAAGLTCERRQTHCARMLYSSVYVESDHAPHKA
ncbi:MAG TPA: class I SAM-dependent methyltransferase [Opitutae bacterium]|nr:class I SAM-dependent methyltransferase [Opitutae bacterium]